ncbi:IS1595 family transposase [Mucilaginibacter sp. NFR10]|jgi:transposase-like protein|uniref:IS1595 family transposase n=1 Tax=Mucilaginibacter sp. NFR10 TaxID=1566292 RepID=UPI00087176AB|nr:IS1595 family transposase [Mucilaginibacter sp. NFR10]SCW47330.1 Transposase [Mucilaginibacter sp. NFR10]
MIPHSEFKTIIDLVTRFPNEKACHQYLASRRWSDGILTCPHAGCSGDRAYVFKDGFRYKCQTCKRLFNAKTGTIMEASKLDTIKWFMAIYLFMHKKGISSIQLGKDIGVTQKTAWFILQRIRKAMGNEPNEQLEGVVEIDESFVGGKARFKHKNKRKKYNPGRGWYDKTPVLGMLQRGGKVKAMVIPDVLMLTLKKHMYTHVKGGSDVMGDGFNGYRSLELAYNMQYCDHGKGIYGIGDIHTNTIEGFWSGFKKGIAGIYHKTTPRHLNGYVQEFVFRYNYRHLTTPQQMEQVFKLFNCRLKQKELSNLK